MTRRIQPQRDTFAYRFATTDNDLKLNHKSYSGGGGMVEAYHPGQPSDWKGGKNLVGYLGYEPDGVITYVEVHPDFQGKGIGKAMLDHGRQHHPIHHSEDLTESGRAWAEKNADLAPHRIAWMGDGLGEMFTPGGWYGLKPGSNKESRTAHRTAMPVPTKVPSTRNQWIKEHERLEKKRDKAGLPVELVPNFDDDWDNQVYDQNWDTEGLRGGRGSWYARPVEYEGKGQPGIAYRRKVLNEGSERAIPIDYLIHHDDDGNITGILSHYPEGTPFEKPGSITVTVHPQLRGQGIGGKLTEEAEKRFGLNLDEQQFTPLGYEMYRRLKHQRGEEVPNIFNERVSAFMYPPKVARLAVTETPSLTEDYLNSLQGEFDKWYAQTEPIDPDMSAKRDHPIGWWPNVEHFFTERYPAAFRGFGMGLEEARPLVRGEDNTLATDYPSWWENNGDQRDYASEEPYETGHEALAKHGYDPKMVAAAFVLLHNRLNSAWSPRDEELAQDVDFLSDLFQTRVKMQREHDKRQKVLVDAATAIRMAELHVAADTRRGEDLYIDGVIDRISKEFDGWWKDYEPKFIKQHGFGWKDYAELTGDTRGPIGHWPHAENFLKDNYPAAYRGFDMGYEKAQQYMDEVVWKPDPDKLYETGPEAVAKYGYDPKEIAATVLMLHSQTHPGRAFNDHWMQSDLDRIYQVYRTRQKMERNRPKIDKVIDEADAMGLLDQQEEDFPVPNGLRAASVSQDLVDRLHGEFHDWYDREGLEALEANDPVMGMVQQRERHPAIREVMRLFVEDGRKAEIDRRGPIGYWPNIENFLKKHYPAAHMNHPAGMEIAGPHMDAGAYESGPEAVAAHGYDPAEIAAAMVLLHNKSHPLRGYTSDDDQKRLLTIFKQRQKMQRAYEQRKVKDLVTASTEEQWYDSFLNRLASGASTSWGLLRLAASDDIGIDDLHGVFRDYVLKAKPIDPKTKKPHTPESAIKDWLSGVAPFIQAVRPDLPFERYKYEPHTRGLYEHQDVPSLVAKLIALHTREKYGTETMYQRQKEFEQLAQGLVRDMDSQAAKGHGIRSDGTFGPMPVFMGNGVRPDGSFGPQYVYNMPGGSKVWHYPDKPFSNGQLPPPPPQQTGIAPAPTLQRPRGDDLRRRMMQPRNPMAQPADTTPKPQGMGQGRAAARYFDPEDY